MSALTGFLLQVKDSEAATWTPVRALGNDMAIQILSIEETAVADMTSPNIGQYVLC